jgi:hypothetical protein
VPSAVGAADCVIVVPAPPTLLSACACWPVPKAIVMAAPIAIIPMPSAASTFFATVNHLSPVLPLKSVGMSGSISLLL